MASGQEKLTGYSIYHEDTGPFGGQVAEYEPLVSKDQLRKGGGKTYGDVDDDIIVHVESMLTKLWFGAFAVALLLAGVFFISIFFMFGTGFGI
jgi:hypothetical protein